MSCPSAIYASNSNFDAAAGQTVPFGIIVRRYGRNCQLEGGGINLVGAGYYAADVSISFAPTEAGDVTFQLLQDGVEIPGATATLTGAAGETACASISALARNCGCNCNTTLTLTVSAAGTFANLATRVIKG